MEDEGGEQGGEEGGEEKVVEAEAAEGVAKPKGMAARWGPRRGGEEEEVEEAEEGTAAEAEEE